MLLKSRNIIKVLVLGLLLTGCASKAETSAPELLEPALGTEKTATASYGEVYIYDGYSGYVIPKMEELSFSDGGEIEEIFVSVGDEVKEGDVLANLKNSSEAYDEIAGRLKNTRETNKAESRKREIEIEKCKLQNIDYERLSLVNRQKLEIESLDEKYLQELLNTEKQKLSGSSIIAPFDGRVAAIGTVRRGEYIDEDVPFIVIASCEECYVYSDYMTEKAANLYDSKKALIGGLEYDLTYIPYEASEINKLIGAEEDYYSIFKVEGGRSEMIGMQAAISLKKNVKENVLRIPVNALHRENGLCYVYKDAEGAREVTEIKTGVVGLMYAEVLEGLKEGDVVYVTD